MIIFDVSLNGEPLKRSGKSDLTVMSAIVSAVGVLGPDSIGVKHKPGRCEIDFYLGGLTSAAEESHGVHLNWLPKTFISVGDEITIRILDEDNPDSYIAPKVDQIENYKREIEKENQKRYEEAKRIYFELREKYEGNNDKPIVGV